MKPRTSKMQTLRLTEAVCRSRFHDTRHTHASIPLAQRVHVEHMSKLVVDSTIELAPNRCRHLIETIHSDDAATLLAVSVQA